MADALRPADWVDWLLLALVAAGVPGGLRRGLIGSVARLAASVGALAAAAYGAGPLLAAADRRWHVAARLADWLAGRLWAPGVRATLPEAVGRWLSSLPAGARPGWATDALQAAPAAAATPAAEGALVAVAGGLLAAAAFLAVFAVAGEVLRWLALPLVRRGPRGAADALLGAAFAVGERLVVAGVLVEAVAALGGLPGLEPVSAAVRASHWAPILLRWFAAVPWARAAGVA